MAKEQFGRYSGTRAGLFREMIQTDIKSVRELGLDIFCSALIETRNVSDAARLLGVARKVIYEIRREHQHVIDAHMLSLADGEKIPLLAEKEPSDET